MEALYSAYKNDVIQYKKSILGLYTDKIINGRPVYILIDQWTSFFIGTIKKASLKCHVTTLWGKMKLGLGDKI